MTIAENVKTDNDKEYIATGNRDNVNAFYVPDLQYTTIGKFIIYRLMEDRDVKILITGKGKTTGTGKTTLAIALADFVTGVRNYLFEESIDWTTKEYSFMDVWDYLKSYKTAEQGVPLITDELEYMADRRSHQTHENKKFSQAWSVLRWKNVVTIGTAPGLSDLEKRIPEGADIWINVVHKGKANVYYLTMNDFDMNRIFKRMRMGKYKESLLWNPLDNDDNYQWLKEKKEEIGVPGIDDTKEKQIEESDLNELERNIRNQYVEDTLMMLENQGVIERVSQEKIANAAGVSQAQVSKIKRELEESGAL